MKRYFLFVAVFLIILSCIGCSTSNPENTDGTLSKPDIEEGPFTSGNDTSLNNAIPVKISSDMLQVCYDYVKTFGYEIDKDRYNSVLLGKSLMPSVYLDDASKSDILDENDYLIIFDSMKVVVDSNTGIVLGHIPYV